MTVQQFIHSLEVLVVLEKNENISRTDHVRNEVLQRSRRRGLF